MPEEPELQPLPKQKRRRTFVLLVLIFAILLPFLYLYATGYRFEFSEKATLVSTGGMYISADRTDTLVFINDELIEESRVFRSAVYVQSLDPQTHRISVQKEGHHTWVKELPVYAHLVTEAQAFNMPLVPQVRVIAEWETATGSAVVPAGFLASTTNEFVATSTRRTTAFVPNQEYEALLELFATTSATSTESIIERVTEQVDLLFQATTTATSSIEVATTSKEWRGVKLYESEEDVFAAWVGARDDMPYYFCFEPFERYSTSTATSTLLEDLGELVAEEVEDLEANTIESVEFVHPVQTVPEDAVCQPTIQIDRKWEEVSYFDFFPGSTDLVVMARESGVYVVEIDNRAWQNVQPLFLGEDLEMRVENGNVYVYDGTLIYQIVLDL